MPLHAGRILYEDQWLLAVHKLPGELTVAGKGKVKKLPLLDFLKKDYPGIHPINRLDFETSGIVLFARNSAVLKQVMDSESRGWLKTYQALVAGVIRQERGDIRLRVPSRTRGEDVDAHTRYHVMERFPFATLVEAQIESGKRHQIRRHFALIGHPLALDDEYGQGKFNNTFGQKFGYHRFFLHAQSVRFPHPVTKQEVHVEDPLPQSFEAVLKTLRKAR